MSKRVSAALRLQIRIRAKFGCEYCLLHEDDALFPHVPDHIISLRHHGQTNIENLAWSCYLCNHLKGCDLASLDPETGRVIRLFHPRKDRWSEHFRLDGATIFPLTAIGRATAELLELNSWRSIAVRGNLIDAGRYPRLTE